MATRNQISPAAQAAQTRSKQLDMNNRARQYVIENAIDMWQQLPSQTQVGANPRGQVYNFQARNVGLIKRLLIKVEFDIIQAAAETLMRTAFGPSNIFSSIILTDLNNFQRISTTGWHLYNLATARRQRAFAAAFTNDSPVLTASNINVAVCPSPVTNASLHVRFFYEVPVSYSDTDLRGGIYASTTGANVNLQLTVNPNLVVGSAADPTQAVYISSTAGDVGTISNLTILVYQNYLDQIPTDDNGKPILPVIDMSYSYMLLNTFIPAVVSGQENNYAYSNFRSFLSTMAIYDNFGTGTAAQADVSYFAIQVANSTNLIKWDPYTAALMTREMIGDDFPSQQARALYYFDHRIRPINTDQFGNTLWVINPAQAQAAAQILLGLEMMALQDNIINATSPARI